MKNKNLNLSKIDTIILAGGLGTRLSPLLKNKPKCLAPINGKPFIDILLDNFIKQGLRRFILCVGYLKEQVIQHLQKRSDCEIIFSEEINPLGTGGALKKAQKLIKSDPYIVLNGDSFIDIDIVKYIKWFKSNKKIISIVTKNINNSIRYGNINFNKNGLLTSFHEKKSTSSTNYINAGMYLFQKNKVDFSCFNKNFLLEVEFFPSLIKEGISVYRCDGDFIDIGTEKSYNDVQRFFKG